MRRDDDDAARLREVTEEPEHAVDLDVVEVRGWLVGEHEWRIVRECPCDGDTLLLTTRHVGGAVVHPVVEPHLLEERFGARLRLALGDLARLRRDLDVLTGGEAGNQVERLEDDANRRCAGSRRAPGRRGR